MQEIRCFDSVTRLASAPAFIKGVVKLHGLIVPIVDMRIKLGILAPTYDNSSAVVIILNIAGQVIGMAVDSVSGVTTLAREQIRPAPEAGTPLATDCRTGLAAIDGRMLILVDIDKLMSRAWQEISWR